LDKSGELAKLERITNIQLDPDPAVAKKGGKCMLLKPEVKPEGVSNNARSRNWRLIHF
jgi:tRNA (guanine37-N1)-methyltransferase